MTLLQSGLAKSLAAAAYTIDQSLRFNIADGPYLERTFGTGNRRAFTISLWFKCSVIATSSFRLFSVPAAGTDGPGSGLLAYNSSGTISFQPSYDNVTAYKLETSAVFRDPSAWYSIVAVWDSDNVTEADRIRLYVNGVRETAFSSTAYPPRYLDCEWMNTAITHYISTYDTDEAFIGGYLAEYYFIDGQALTAASFGETDEDTNQWEPIDAVDDLTFGTNGFYQKYGDSHGVQAFTSTGANTWTCPTGVTSVEILTVAGGGGGGDAGSGAAGGGGAGGVVHNSAYTVVPGVVYDITVGTGGASGSGGSPPGSNGADSVFNVNAEGSGATVTAVGGGGGGQDGEGGVDGGSGGGEGADEAADNPGEATQGDSGGGTGYGNNGGEGASGEAGGGGGANAVGADANGGAGDGGAGKLFSTFVAYGTDSSNVASTGSNGGYFGGGGGGGSNNSEGAAGDGGVGGGADGTYDATAVVGKANTGGGGAGPGAGGTGNGSAGGTGVVLIKIDSGFGTDSSGNDNTFTPTNLVASDKMVDSPTNNFCTIDPLDNYYAGATLTEGNLKQSIPSANTTFNTSTFASASDKWYCEFYVTTGTTTSAIGISSPPAGSSTYLLGDSAYAYAYLATGDQRKDSVTSSYGSTWTTGDIMAIALDLENNKLYFAKNNTWQDSGVPTSGATGTGAISILAASAVSFSNSYFMCAGHNTTGTDSVFVANFGQDSSFAGAATAQGNADGNGVGDFYYAPPTDYLALCTSNLDDPSIALPGDYFNTVLYTGNGGASVDAITGVGFQPDIVWIKSRSASTSNYVTDSVRGVAGSGLLTDSNAVSDGIERVSSFDSDGFTLPDTLYSFVNTSSGSYVAWNWLAGGAPTATNSAGAGATPTAGSVKIDGSNLGSALAGTIAATKISANTASGFSIVEFTGDETTGSTVGHGLSQTPELIIFKCPSVDKDWAVGSNVMSWTSGDFLTLNSAVAEGSNTNYWDTPPTSSVFEVNSHNSVNNTNGMLAYCFHSVEGYSKVCRYEGNGNTDGTFIYTGFRPAFLLAKNVDAGASNWIMEDNKRNPYNPEDTRLWANLNDAETTAGAGYADFDFVSNGVKIRGDSGNYNSSAKTYLCIVFAESPFKNSPAR